VLKRTVSSVDIGNMTQLSLNVINFDKRITYHCGYISVGDDDDNSTVSTTQTVNHCQPSYCHAIMYHLGQGVGKCDHCSLSVIVRLLAGLQQK